MPIERDKKTPIPDPETDAKRVGSGPSKRPAAGPGGKVSAYILAYNEEDKIRDALASVLDWADEVVVADSFSTDGPVRIAREMGARVVSVAFEGFGRLRNDAVAATRFPWVFSLDADERCTPE